METAAPSNRCPAVKAEPVHSQAIRADTFAVTVMTLAGAVLRVYRIDSAEMWTDEMTGVIWSGWGILQFFEVSKEYGVLHFPLLTWIMKGLIAALGHGELTYRLVGLVPGTLAIPAIYVMGRELLTREVGLVAALMLTVSTTGLFVSQEAWDYGLVLLLVVLSALTFFRAWRQDRWRDWLLAGLCLLLCFYMHLFDALVVGALFLVYGLSLMVPSQDRLEWRQRWRGAIKPMVVGAGLAVLCLPGALLIINAVDPVRSPMAEGAVGGSMFAELLTTVIRHFGYDRPVSVYLVAGLVILGLPFAVKRPAGWLLTAVAASAMCVPLFMACAMSYQFRVRHYTFALPFVLAAMACGIVTLRRLLAVARPGWRGFEIESPWPGLALAGLLVAIPAAQGLRQYYMIRAPQSVLYSHELRGTVEERLIRSPTQIQLYSKGKEPEFLEVAALLRRNMEPGDILIVDTHVPGEHNIGRGILFHLNRRFGLNLAAHPLWGFPVDMAYDPDALTVMLMPPQDAAYDSVRTAKLPGNGLRVFRASHRYPVGEVPGMTLLKFAKLNVGVSNECFRDRDAVIAHLQAHDDLTRAADLARKADALKSLGKVGEAATVYRESLGLLRTSRAADGLGAIFLGQDRAEEALPLLEFAATTRGNRADYWYRLGRAQALLKRDDAAIASYETALDLPNPSPWTYKALAELYEGQGQLQRAHDAYVALARQSEEPAYLLSGVQARLSAGRLEAALSECLEVAAQHPEYGAAHVLAAKCCERLKRPEEAYAHAVEAARLMPDRPDVLAVCARYHVHFGKPDEALALLTAALERFPENADLKRELDRVRDLRGEQQAP